MTDLTIHNFENFQYFLDELEKNLSGMDAALEQQYRFLKGMHVLHGVVSKMCQNWRNQLKHQQ